MASSAFLKNIKKNIKDTGGTQENLKLAFAREKLTLADYRSNWAEYITDAAEHLEACGKGDCEHSKERRMVCRHHRNQWRIKLVRAGIIVPLDGHTDILMPNKEGALSMLRTIAAGFEDGDLDEELQTWMDTRDEHVAKSNEKKLKDKDYTDKAGKLPKRHR
jgi:hypothetical protein